jgi:hypothetical protein
MNQFGGEWTDRKMRIVVDYAKAYLTIMAKRNYKTIYFDGFAGSGSIYDEDGDEEKTKKGTALQILDIDNPKSFVLKNSMNSVMYHFMMATNNKVAHKIANEVIKPKFGE